MPKETTTRRNLLGPPTSRMRFSACAGEVVPAAAAPGPSQMPGQCPSPGTKESSDCIRDPTCVEGAAGTAVRSGPRVSFPWPHRLCLKWPPTLYHLRSPTAQSKLTELHLPCRSSGRAIFLSSAAAQSTHLSRPSYRPLVPSEGRPSLCQQNMPGTPTSFQQSVGMPGMPMQEQTPPGYRSGAVSQAGLKQVEGLWIQDSPISYELGFQSELCELVSVKSAA